jgi:hypothetical protein
MHNNKNDFIESCWIKRKNIDTSSGVALLEQGTHELLSSRHHNTLLEYAHEFHQARLDLHEDVWPFDEPSQPQSKEHAKQWETERVSLLAEYDAYVSGSGNLRTKQPAMAYQPLPQVEGWRIVIPQKNSQHFANKHKCFRNRLPDIETCHHLEWKLLYR